MDRPLVGESGLGRLDVIGHSVQGRVWPAVKIRPRVLMVFGAFVTERNGGLVTFRDNCIIENLHPVGRFVCND